MNTVPIHLRPERVRRAVRYGDFTFMGGVAYEWGLAGPGGAWFTLLREPHHTDDDIKAAKRQLRDERDVVSLTIDKVSP